MSNRHVLDIALATTSLAFRVFVVKWLLWLTISVLFTDFAAVCVILRDLRERISEKWAEKLTGCINLSFNANSTK